MTPLPADIFKGVGPGDEQETRKMQQSALKREGGGRKGGGGQNCTKRVRERGLGW